MKSIKVPGESDQHSCDSDQAIRAQRLNIGGFSLKRAGVAGEGAAFVEFAIRKAVRGDPWTYTYRFFNITYSYGFAKSLRTTVPPFMTNFTCSSCVTSARGSPSTAIRSANFPGSIVPTRSDQLINSAALIVAA